MKKKIEKIIASLLMAVMVISMVFTNVTVSYAQPGDEGEWEDTDWDDDSYNIGADTYYVSFGTVYQGDIGLEYVPVTITNYGSSSINMSWYKSDAEGAFQVSAPSSLYLAPGQSSVFYVTMLTNKNPGEYTGYLNVASDSDPDYSEGLCVVLSGVIMASQPYIDSVTVYPSEATLTKGSGMNFQAIVVGGNNPDTNVSWHITGQSAAGTDINSSGYLTVDPAENSNSIRVTATSVVDQSQQGFAYVTLTGGRYTVNVSANPSNGGVVSGGGGYNAGDDVTVYANPNNGFTFTNWTSNGKVVSNDAKYSFSRLGSDMNLTANFQASACYVKITKNIDKAGNVTGNTNVAYNGSITLKASANSGYEFVGWYENNNLLSNQTSVTLNGIKTNRDITAKFNQTVFNVSVQANPSNAGMVTGSGNYNRGSNVTITAKPVDGYKFISWTIDNNVKSTDASCTLKGVDRDQVIVANFEKVAVQTYKIYTTVASGEGTIYPGGVTQVTRGSSMVVSIAPANGYEIQAVAVDGAQKGAISSYSFSNITADHGIAVAFVKKKSSNQKAPVDPKPNPTQTPMPIVKNDENDKPTNEQVVVEDTEEEAKEYIEEQDITPIDQGGEEEYDYDSQEGVLQDLNITADQAADYLSGPNGVELLELAARNQTFKVCTHNEFSNVVKETETTPFTNLVAFPNLKDVIAAEFTPEEKLNIVAGTPAGFNVNVFDNDDLQTDDDRMIAKHAINHQIQVGKYFEIVTMKTFNGSSQVVTNTQVPMTIVLSVPEKLRSSGRNFCIIRAHHESDGSVSISYLQNESNDPNIIQFTTDKFSSYAIGYTGGEHPLWNKTNIIAFSMLLAAAAVTALLIVGCVHAGKARRRRKARK